MDEGPYTRLHLGPLPACGRALSPGTPVRKLGLLQRFFVYLHAPIRPTQESDIAIPQGLTRLCCQRFVFDCLTDKPHGTAGFKVAQPILPRPFVWRCGGQVQEKHGRPCRRLVFVPARGTERQIGRLVRVVLIVQHP